MVGLVPPLAGAFQDRAERSHLRAAAGGGTVVLCQVLTGMGGVGKTQLAADYAHEVWNAGHGVDLVVWVTASSRNAVIAAFAQAGARVCGADPSDPLQAARSFLAWLYSAGRRWLVVLDDVADPADVSGLWPPTVAHGQTVVTTRRRDRALISSGRRRVEVGVFTPAEAAAYLGSVLAAEGRAEPPSETAGLAEELGCLPLALSQAAAYLVDAGISVGEYRELLARQARVLEDISPQSLPDDQTHTMAAAWELSVGYADRLRPEGLARPMLELVALLAPHTTPMTALTSRPALDYLTAHRTPPGAGARVKAGPGAPVTPQDAAGALRALHRLSLLTAPGPAAVPENDDAGAVCDAAWDGRVVRVHQVVQRATRDTLSPDHYRDAARSAGDALVAVWPGVERDTALAQALRACTTALISATGEGTRHTGCLFQPDAHEVLFRLGRSLGESGQVTAAASHYQRLAESTRHHLGPDHPHTLTTRHNLAHWRGEAGDAAGAAAELAEVLEDRLRVLGPDHPHTLSNRSTLARWRGETGDAAGAAAELAEVLEDRLRVLGPDHPDILTTRNNWAYWRGRAGDAVGAAVAFAELLEDRLRLLGSDHPHTLTARHNLARWQGEAGNVAGAAAGFVELLEDRSRVLGPDHPATLTTRHNLAHWRGMAGDTAGAVAAFAELLEDRLRVLGPDHPATLISRRNLAHWRRQAAGAAGGATTGRPATGIPSSRTPSSPRPSRTDSSTPATRSS